LETRQPFDTIVVGAGIAGLSLARELVRRGQRPLLLERARGVGGRCATRRISDQPVDFGLPFLHGRDPRFLETLESVTAATPVPGWPARKVGRGLPCQPEAFDGRDRLLAYREGVTRFPKHLAAGLDIVLEARVVGLALAAAGRTAPAGISVLLENGEALTAASVVLTIPAPRAADLAAPLSLESEALRDALPLLSQIRMLPCLTVVAGYNDGTPCPPWDVLYPDTTTMVHTVLHDSAKRGPGAPLFLVVQGRPGFSREHLGVPPEVWGRELLWEAGEFLGTWVERPARVQYHRWTFARCTPATELAAPVASRLANGAILGFCGDGFSPAGGAEGAWLSGIAMAARLPAGRRPAGRAGRHASSRD
jgi:hypothetical protein